MPINTCKSVSEPTPRWRSGSCTSSAATGSSTAATSGPGRWASTGSKRKYCRASRIPGLAEADIERFAALYGAAKTSFIRLGEGMTRLARGGEALRAVALLPGVTGAYGRRGGGALLMTASSCELNYDAVRQPSGPEKPRLVNPLRLGDALLTMTDPPLRGLFIAANNPAVTCPDAG